jgi:hypothetical protein
MTGEAISQPQSKWVFIFTIFGHIPVTSTNSSSISGAMVGHIGSRKQKNIAERKKINGQLF